jgi:hypothetical protein
LTITGSPENLDHADTWASFGIPAATVDFGDIEHVPQFLTELRPHRQPVDVRSGRTRFPQIQQPLETGCGARLIFRQFAFNGFDLPVQFADLVPGDFVGLDENLALVRSPDCELWPLWSHESRWLDHFAAVCSFCDLASYFHKVIRRCFGDFHKIISSKRVKFPV